MAGTAGTPEGKGTAAPEIVEDPLEDLCFGDVVTIYKKFSSLDEGNDTRETKNDNSYKNGFLGTQYGGTIDNNLMVLNSGIENGRATVPGNIRGCLFRILPKLGYLERGADMNANVFKKEKALESTANRDEIRLKEGETVAFGETIQLQHVLTGKFVTIRYAFSELFNCSISPPMHYQLPPDPNSLLLCTRVL